MHHRMLVALLTILGAASALLDKRQDGPVAPDTASDCTYYETVIDSSRNCKYLEEYWELTHEQFLDYNPSVKSDCSGIKVGNSYCVEVNNGLPRPVKPSPTSTSTTVQPSSTGIKKPSPTQSGLIESCTDFYFAVDNDRCDIIVAKYGTFKLDDFVKWNPAVGSTCSGIWANTWYCVGVPGTPTTRPTTTPAIPTPTGIVTPSPVRQDMVQTCNRFHFVEQDENCDTIIRKYGTFTFSQFFEWNPSVGSNCGGLWLRTWYCIGVPGTTTPTPAITTKPITTFTTSTRPTPTDKPCILKFLNGQYCCPEDPKCCNPNAPADPQPGTVCGCKKWHKVAKDDNCDNISSRYGISRTNFDKWNPTVNNGGDCKTMWLNYNVCVGV